MQQIDIKYGGMTTRPSDYTAPDGDLSVCYNFINEDGSLKPIFPPKQVFSLPDYEKFFCIHKVDNKENYILYTKENHLQAYRLVDTSLRLISDICTDTIKNVICVGATLAIITERAITYALYKENKYTFLGAKPPFIDLAFGLHGNFEVSNQFTSFDEEIKRGMLCPSGDNFNSAIDLDFSTDDAYYAKRFSTDDIHWIQSKLSNVLMAEINKFIQQRSVENGKFIFPFFVRYALRLYDGSHILHSAPLLMVPNNYLTSFIEHADHDSNKDEIQRIKSMIAAMVSKLDFTVLSTTSTIEELKTWSDIIKDIDIFVSAPIFTYDQNGKVTGWTSYKNTFLQQYNSFSHSKLDNGNAFTDSDYEWRFDSRTYSKRRNFAQLFVRTFGHSTSLQQMPFNEFTGGDFTCPCTIWKLPRVDEKRVRETVSTCALFYKVATVTVDSLTTNARRDVDISADTLKTLQQREQLQDDYLSHHDLIAEYAYNYNARLYLADIKQSVFNGFKPSSMLPYSLCHSVDQLNFTAYVFIKKEGKEIIVKQTTARETSNGVLYLFYPDADAYKMILAHNDSSTRAIECKLTPHNLLNGAYWYGDLEETVLSSVHLPFPSSDKIVSTPNKLFASEVNNPFFFPVKNRNNIGTTKIVAICSASKALSQGQFGQFPLYAFTLDGVWALEIGTGGEISTKQPATRDVISSADSLLQVDGGIVFATEQGVMLLSGSESVCMSEVIDEKPFTVIDLPHITELLQTFDLTNLDGTIAPFKEYLKECKLAYDYANSRILIFNKSKSYGYIYSLNSKYWTLFETTYQDVINNYPTSLVIDSTNGVYDLSILDKNGSVNGLLVTRPLKLSAPDVLKTIRSSLHRVTSSTSTPSALYGSVDCVNFHLVTSSEDKYIRSIHGTPYNYFIFAIGAHLKNGESIAGTSILFDLKRNNKLR